MLEVIDGRDQLTPVHIPRPKVIVSGEDSPGVREIVDLVRLRGDDAVVEFSERFDGASLTPDRLRVEEGDIHKARSLVRPELIDALEVMAERLRSTSERQVPKSWTRRESDEFVGELIRPLRRVGIYVPGGRAAYPSSLLMAAIPASVAGVEGLAVATPPSVSGEVPEAVLAACSVAAVDEVYRIGGAQAIAALAYGTQSVRPVEKIVGPGNLYVTLAKRMVRGWVGTDSEAGPTEICIVADASANARVLALDLIAQAEHGPHGAHVLITWAPELLQSINGHLDELLTLQVRTEDIENALIEGGRGVLVRDLDHALDTANAFSPEHLELVFAGAEESLGRVRNAGSVFVGPWAPVPVGDYVGGTNHILPSGGTARWASGLNAAEFVKRIYVSGFERGALERLRPHVAALAEAEGLPGHALAVEERLDGGRGGGPRR